VAGKDRTGVVDAFILSVLGVPYENFHEDYLYTNSTIEKMKANFKELGFLKAQKSIRPYWKPCLSHVLITSMPFFEELESIWIYRFIY
jgi:protein tyrosine/serine phosphatase